jgi:hypothetical protein
VAVPESSTWWGRALFTTQLKIVVWVLRLHTVVRGTPVSGYRQPPFLYELYTLFSRTTHNRGNLISVGGVRELSPNYVSEDTPYLSDDHVGCSNIRSSSKRPIREDAVDCPPKKKMSLDDHIANIFESISIRNRRTLSWAQRELDEVVRLLKQDGLGADSDFYCMGLMLCNRPE